MTVDENYYIFKSMKLFQLLSHFSDKSLFHTNFTTASLIKEIDLLLSQFQVIVTFAYTLETWTKSRACFHRSSRLEMLRKKGGTGCFPAKFAEFLRTPPLAAFCFQGIAKLKNGLEWVKLLNWGSDS